MKKAREYCLKAETYYLYFGKAANAEAQRLYRQAIELDPQCGRALADLGYTILHAWLFNWDAKASLDEALGLCERARSVDCENYYWRWMMADIQLYRREYEEADRLYGEAMERSVDQAIPEEQRALRADWADYLLLTGQPQAAVEQVQQAIAESPLPERWFYWVQAWALYETDQFEASVAALRQLHNPRNAIRKNLIANYVALSDQAGAVSSAEAANYLELARFHAKRFLTEEASQGVTYVPRGQLVWPGLSEVEENIPFRDRSRLERWKGHLERAFEGLLQP